MQAGDEEGLAIGSAAIPCPHTGMTRGQPLYIDTDAMLDVKGDPAGLGLAMTLIGAVWEPERLPFTYDPDALYDRLVAAGHTGIRRSDLDIQRDAAARYFVVLDDGRWAPSPEFFSVTDGNEGGRIV